MNYKDNFSEQAKIYAKFRPKYPAELYDFLLPHIKNKRVAWDCATGNGQVANILAKDFKKVIATDASSKQIEQATQKNNIFYEVATAEKTEIKEKSIDFISVAQAVHWFDFEKFYTEVRRVAKQDTIIAIWGYGLLEIEENIDRIINQLYFEVLKNGGYWDKEREHLDNHYESIPFPFEKIETPSFKIQLSWNKNQLIGYLNTWSSVRKYIRTHQKNPVDIVEEKLERYWNNPIEEKFITWDLYLLAGTVF